MRAESTRNRTLPYTYEARVDILDGHGKEPVHDHYFSDTLCGLIEYLAEQGFAPARVELYGDYRGKQIRLDNTLVANEQGEWLQRPELCRALETHYRHSHDECYKGHVERGQCSFADRDRAGSGPVW
jgi:hypothetical protein